MVRFAARWLGLGSGWTLALACSVGTDADGDNFGFNPSAGNEATGPSDDSSSSSGSDDEGKEGSGDDDTQGDSSDSGTSTGGADGSSSGEPGSTGTDDGSSAMCQNDLTCPMAEPIGGVAGDEGTPSVVITGDTPTWVTFQVSENSSDPFGEKLSFTATLQSPASADFDLFLFRGPEGGVSGCGGTPGQSTNAGGSDSVSMTWGEGAFANNGDDGAWVAVEIRAKNGTCDPGSEWTLTVQGDT